jgi:3'-phosphoadenosine 5'-phosphosulfate sulfotransferase (PAPS reductase)/FAD synthetase
MTQADILPGLPDALAAVPPKASTYEARTLDEAIARSHALLDEVCERWPAERILMLISGGNDSTLLGHLMRDRADTIVFINTGIGIPATRRYVHDIAGAWGKQIIEARPPDAYRDLVLGRVLARTGPNAGIRPVWKGFPGPAGHPIMYQRLKERALEQVRRDLVGPRGKSGQIVFLGGMRWSESKRRFRTSAEIDHEGAIIWCSPIVHWTLGHLAEYRERHRCVLGHVHAEHMLCHPDALPLNEVTVHLHMSGDCLCGCYAKEGEIAGIELFAPEIAEQIHAIEAEARACGIPPEWCTWGWGATAPGSPPVAGRLCSKCAPPIPGQLVIGEDAADQQPEKVVV